MIRITIRHGHGNIDTGPWDYFQAKIFDDSKPVGNKILACASGEAQFIFRVVADWVKEYQP